MKGLILRSLSGIIYVGLIVLGIISGQYVFVTFSIILAMLAIGEFTRLTNDHNTRKLAMVVDCIGAFIGIFFLSKAVRGEQDCWLWGFIFVCYLIVRLVMQLYTRNPQALNNLAYSLMAQLYITLPLGLMSYIYFDYSPALLLAMFVMIWLNDTGAFCVGSLLGRHKMFPRISPKKSWEGLVGGIAFAVGSAFVLFYCFAEYFPGMPLWQLVGMGAVVGVFATWGDLVESLIKRTLGVKDSGRLIPGHGGILDRIDSLLMVAPALAAYLFFTAP